MKRSAPSPQLKQMLNRICAQLQMSLETYFGAIEILMDPELPEMANQDPDVALAALFIAHKLNDVHLVSVQSLSSEETFTHSILLMEQMILRELRYRVSRPLLISAVLEKAHKWDLFIQEVTCIDTHISNGTNLQQLLRIVQKIVFSIKSHKLDKKKLSAAIIFCFINAAEKKIHQNDVFKTIRSTQIIITDFLQEEYDISLNEIDDQIQFVRSIIMEKPVLREITNRIKSPKFQKNGNKTHNLHRKNMGKSKNVSIDCRK